MSDTLPNFQLLRPDTIQAAVAILHDTENAKLCAGGTDLIVNMRRGLATPKALVDLTAIKEMQQITNDTEGLHIGAGVTLSELAQNTPHSAIAQAALAIAGPGHRFAATVGGNLCLDTRCQYYNQSHWWRKSNDFCLKYRGETCHVAPSGNRCRAAFTGDLAPAFLVLGAEVDIASPQGIRRIPLAELYSGDGTDYLTLADNEIVTKIHLPPGSAKSVYGKIRIRGALDFPLAGVAIAAKKSARETRFRIALTGTNSRPVLLDDPAPFTTNDSAETYFSALNKAVQKAASPQRSTITAPLYRKQSIGALAARLAQGLTND
ncbi:MAG: FAD binding domain-containing protein [Rhodobacteraceae bacterium]|nr:FAD binding domain-containing protein [Paracoccaceae bacterium]